MTLRVPASIAVGLSLIVLPVIIVQAQSEGETPTPPPETVAEPAADAAATEPTDEAGPAAAAAAAEEGSALGAETGSEAASSSEASEGSETPAPGSDTTSTSDQSVAPAAASTSQDFLTLDTASSTASSTEPVEDPPAVPYEEPFVLQPAVTLHVEGSSISADIQLENLTCKSCEKVLPAATVKAYYTPWYPNDGEVKEVGDRAAEQELTVSDVALWASRSMSWSAADIAPGRYYFVVVVDPENAIGAYRMQRMEFAI